MNTNFKKSSTFEGIYYSVSSDTDIETIWNMFINDEEQRNLYLSSNSLEELKHIFFGYFKIIEAAGGVVFNENGQLLCIKRWGLWDLPKGKIEKGESKEHAAVREVEEETGISQLRLIQLKNTTYHIYQSPHHEKAWILKPTYWYLMGYNGREQLVPQIKEDITEAKWFEKNELNTVKQNTYVSLKSLFEF